MPRNAGTFTAVITLHCPEPRPRGAARLALDLREGEKRTCQGWEMRRQAEHRVVRDAVEAECDGAEEAADEQVVDVVHEVPRLWEPSVLPL
jgi:hypothetical protein